MMSAKFLGFFTAPFPCPHFDLIYTTKSTQPPLLDLLFLDPLQCGHHIWKLPYPNTTRRDESVHAAAVADAAQRFRGDLARRLPRLRLQVRHHAVKVDPATSIKQSSQ